MSVPRPHLPLKIHALVKTGSPHSTILRFRNFWRTLNGEEAQVPCPLCFQKGMDTPLQKLRLGFVKDRLWCASCHHIFVVEPMTNRH